ncbi:hypothetical protein L596_002592 [Steinernema carpocapsae]|uniref:Uncharacterized protein n=1 Tax=Steinernema carpocapsae TaxID=34508 RepID=A0A4U8UPZ7_STECR|nr:hypothetical protein L596_002592 [Steinernema carpocapsae]
MNLFPLFKIVNQKHTPLVAAQVTTSFLNLLFLKICCHLDKPISFIRHFSNLSNPTLVHFCEQLWSLGNRTRLKTSWQFSLFLSTERLSGKAVQAIERHLVNSSDSIISISPRVLERDRSSSVLPTSLLFPAMRLLKHCCSQNLMNFL